MLSWKEKAICYTEMEREWVHSDGTESQLCGQKPLSSDLKE